MNESPSLFRLHEHVTCLFRISHKRFTVGQHVKSDDGLPASLSWIAKPIDKLRGDYTC